jgi:pimeloyl-ACP methyl ester carboxylesterase
MSKFDMDATFMSQPIKPWMCYYSKFAAGIGTVPPIPFLFVKDENSKIKFYSDAFVDSIKKRTDGSTCITMQTSHWIFREQPDVFNQHVLDFIQPFLGA